MTSGRRQVLAWAWPAATPPAELLGAAFELCLNELSAGPHVNESSLETVINYRAAPAPEAGTHLAGLPPGSGAGGVALALPHSQTSLSGVILSWLLVLGLGCQAWETFAIFPLLEIPTLM